MERSSITDGCEEVVDRSFDAVVLGAGISGLVSASILLEQGSCRVLVVDEYAHVGGNHIDHACGGYTFDVGSFIFQDDSPLIRRFPELLPRYHPIAPTWAKLNPQGAVTDYPFSLSDDFLSAGPVECFRILLSVAFARMFYSRLRNARDFARYWIGARLLHRSGLEHFMQRFCGLPAERIDLKFAEKRMGWTAEHASVTNLARRWLKSPFKKSSTARPVNRQLARPREGFTHLYQPVVRRLEQDGAVFLLGADLRGIDASGEKFVVRVGERSFDVARLVSTIPIDRVRDLCGMPAGNRLPTVTLISLFYSFTGERGFAESILYNFSHGGAWKRLTVYSDFYGQQHGREYFTVEVIGGQVGQSVELAAHDFRRHVADNSLLIGDLQLEGSHVLSNAYPIYTERAGERAEASIAELRALGIESFGRQGGFAYQPTARVSTLEAEAALDRANDGSGRG